MGWRVCVPRGEGKGWLTALVDHVERDVGQVVVFEQVVGRAGKGAHEDRVVLRRDEGDGGEAEVHLPGHFLRGLGSRSVGRKRRTVLYIRRFLFW